MCVFILWELNPQGEFLKTSCRNKKHINAYAILQLSRSAVSSSLQPHESQHDRPPCPSQTPGVYSNSCPSSRWCHPAISSSVVPFSTCPQSLPASGSFPILSYCQIPICKNFQHEFHQQSMRTNFPSFAPECTAVLSFCQMDGLSASLIKLNIYPCLRASFVIFWVVCSYLLSFFFL